MMVNRLKDVSGAEPARGDIDSREAVIDPQAMRPSFYAEGKNSLAEEEGFTLDAPQETEEVTVEGILMDLRYLTGGFPYGAVKEALTRQGEMTPALLGLLEKALEDYDTLEGDYFGHVYALFLLAYFREEAAFGRVIQLASLPEDWPELLLEDIITESLHRIMGSVYDGNLGRLQALIENPKTNPFSREAGLRALLVLVRAGRLERAWVIEYFKGLFYHPTFLEEEEALAITHLVCAAADLYPEELLEDIKIAFTKERVDELYLDMSLIDEVLAEGKEAALSRYLYENPQYAVIDDVMEEMQDWGCFEKEKEQVNTGWDGWLLNHIDKDFPRYDDYETSQPYYREAPKTGRNEPCPCGSGKKYKKCCL